MMWHASGIWEQGGGLRVSAQAHALRDSSNMVTTETLADNIVQLHKWMLDKLVRWMS